MTVDEQTRQRVFARLREVLGEEAAIILMAGVPRVARWETATKADLHAVRDVIGDLRGEVRRGMGELPRRETGQMGARLSTSMATQMRVYMVVTVWAAVTAVALAVAAASLT